MATIVEFVRDTPSHYELINGIKVRTFEVPVYRYFARGEVMYLAFILNLTETDVLNKINEMRIGRKTIEKLYAHRFDVSPWSTHKLTLPSLVDNDVDVTNLEPKDDVVLRASLHFNGVRDFLRVSVRDIGELKEIVILRMVSPRGIVRYLSYV